MDPLGFGLENFDAVGAWRTMDGKFPIDATGYLPDGEEFNGPDELRSILTRQRETFARALTSKLLTYALGRGLERYDSPAVKQIAGRLRKGSFDLPDSMRHERISGRVNPTRRSDDWRDFVDLLRGARDYVRYFDPRYAQATRLVRRAYDIAPTEFVLFCERNPWVKRHWRSM